MNVIDADSIGWGAGVVDYAFSEGGISLSPTVPQLVGIVAASINMGIRPADFEAHLGYRLTPLIAAKARQTFDLFDDFCGFVWRGGAANRDVEFLDPTLAARYPLYAVEPYRMDKG